MLRYKKLGFVELNVTDLERSRAFYTDLVGLQPVGDRDDGAALFRCDSDPYSVVLHQAPAGGFRRAGWILEDESQFDILHGRLREHGVKFAELSVEECERHGFSRATRMVEAHTNATLEFYLPVDGAVEYKFTSTHTHIQRLGHVVFSSPEKTQAIAFFRDVLNFPESDSIGDSVTFLRPFPNPFHHGVGVGMGPRPLFHHLNFMVTSIDDVGRALNRMQQNGVPIVYGPGRHPASDSVFLYFLDPDGTTLEYSFGMEQFAEHGPRDARVLPLVPESFDLWASPRDARFAAAGEMDALLPG